MRTTLLYPTCRNLFTFVAIGCLVVFFGELSGAAEFKVSSVKSYDIQGKPFEDKNIGNETIETTVTNISDVNKIYLSGYQFREDRMVGAGLSIGGLTGFYGGHVDLNLDDENGVWIGVGQGAGYTAVALSWKLNFEGTYLNPYVKAGYASWFNSSGSANGANDSIILKEFLTRDDMNRGKYSLNFLSAAIGAQYNQLNGEWMGFTLFAEAIMMFHPETLRLVPNGAFGSTYYF